MRLRIASLCILFACALPAAAADSPADGPESAGLPTGIGPRTAAALRQVVAREQPDEQLSALLALGQARAGGAETFATLKEKFKSPRADLRLAALWAWGRCAGAPEELTPLLGDASPAVRSEAALTLAELNGQAGLGSLPLQDPKADVRLAATAAAGRLGQFSPGKNPAESAQALRAAPAAAGAEAVNQALADDDPDLLLAGLEAIAAGAPAENQSTTVKRQLVDPRSLVRRAAVSAWAKLQGGAGQAELIPLLADADPNVRRAAAEALGQIGSAELVAPLAARRIDPDRAARRAATAALLKLKERGELPADQLTAQALAAVRETTPEARLEGLGLRGQTRNPAGFPEIYKLARPEIPAKPAAGTDLRESRLVMWTVARCAEPTGAELALKYFVQTGDPLCRVHAARTLGVLKHEPGVPLLVKDLNNIQFMMGEAFFVTTGRLRRVEIESLIQIGTPPALLDLARLSARIKPFEELDNVKLVCSALGAARCAEAAPLLTAGAGNANLGDEQRALLADTVAALGQPRPAAPTPVKRPEYGQYFLKVDED